MRRTALALTAAAAFATLAPAADASLYCSDLGPVPGYGPVCTVKCVLYGAEVNVKDPVGSVLSIVRIVCPA
ncbi:MAG TPA: hypothetical protein VF519_13780 [Mycobacteriales bacterium]